MEDEIQRVARERGQNVRRDVKVREEAVGGSRKDEEDRGRLEEIEAEMRKLLGGAKAKGELEERTGVRNRREELEAEMQSLRSRLDAKMVGFGTGMDVQAETSGGGKGKGKLEEEPVDGSAESREMGGWDRGDRKDSLWQGGGQRGVPAGLSRAAGEGGGGGTDGTGQGQAEDGDDNGDKGKDDTGRDDNSNDQDEDGHQDSSDSDLTFSGSDSPHVRRRRPLSPPSATRQQQRLWEFEARVVNRAIARHGMLHVGYAKALTRSAEAWENAGLYVESERLRREVLKVLGSCLKPLDLDIIKSRATYAAVLCKRGKLTEAEKEQAQVLDDMWTVLDDTHPDKIQAMVSLANTWIKLGGMDGPAEEMLTEVLALRLDLHGIDDPSTISAIENLAAIKLRLQKWHSAENLQKQALVCRERTRGPDSRATVRALAGLVHLKLKQGKFAKAEPLQVQLVEARARLWGIDHPKTLRSLANLEDTRREMESQSWLQRWWSRLRL